MGEDGHFEVETICLPCCDNEENVCQTDVSEDGYEEHSDCSNSSHVELDYSLWSGRVQNLNFGHSTYLDLNIIANTDFSFTFIRNGGSQITKSHLAFGQSPPSYSIETAVLRC